MSEIAHSAVGDVPIDSFKADSHNGGKDAWVCTRCGKVKDLRGDHLRGKMEVRSDCWPCGKKATFKLQSRLSDDGSNNNVPAASTVDDTHQPKGVGNATIVGGFRAPVVPSTGDEHQFLFPAPVLQCSTPSLSADCSSVWKCSTCGKVKPLSGDHLRGKTEVRSDCWPCGCKRTFVLSPVDGEYGCSALPKEDASKTISKASENVKEQATTGAQIPVQPAATPFKSVFGTQSSGDAKPPAATPFKSVFGTQSSGDAKPPAATPFKSVFGTQSSGDAKPPAATPFKSVFGTQSSGDAKPPAATPFKSVFGTQSSGDAKPPAATPFKSVFGTQSNGDAKPPAATPFKSVFGTQSSGDAKPPAATPFKSDSINGFFIKQTRAGIMSEIAHSAVGDVPIDSFKADSHNGGKDAWVCTRCGKVKDLRGDHLRGKMEVRSDCWPCGKKATFKLQSRLSDDDSNNNVPAASTVDDTHQPKGVGNATIVGGFRAPVVPSTGDEHQFLFPAPVLQCSTPSLSADCSSVWKCSTCGKVKPLSGDHLRGKTEVRSDCWPCGCKRTFVLSPVDGEYGCSALPKEDASKTISKASENVKEQATTGAQIPVQPAATPFKSVFGTQSSGDAKPPAATPFKSVFGTQSSGDAKPPAATPFKSVFGTQSSGDAKPPAATPFKSVFDTQSNGDAKPPAATPFKSVFGTQSSGDAKPPAATPFKSVFGTQSSGDAKPPAATPFKSVFGTQSSGDAKPPAATPFKSVFGTQSSGDAKPPAATPFKSVFGTQSNGDAKPPAATPFKSVFDTQSSRDAKPPAATPFKSVFGTQSSGDAKPPAATPFKSDSINGFFIKQTRAGIMSEIAHSAVGDVPIDSFKADSHNGGKDAWVCTRCGKVKDLRGDHLRGKMEVRSDCWPCGKKATFKLQSRLSDDDSNNNVPAASTVDDTHQPKGVGNATIVGGFRAPVVPSTGDEHQFLFPAPVLQCSTPSLSADCSSVWKCSTCGKVKPLSGDHLRGKTEVRSDCWPCGCKRTFVLSPVDGEYGCSALPKEDASKTISKASENVKEQATTGAQIPVQPAATPFKSVFGTQSSGDAKPPAATPFKSVFGTQSSGDAKPPAATPFKSVFGTQSSGDAKPPAATPFKSVFGTQSSGDAKPPAATPFKSVFGTQSSGDAKPPAATPFKSVFGTQSSGDAKPPAATPFKSVFGTQSNGDAKPPAATPFKSVFGTQSSGDAKPPAATPFKSVFDTQSSRDAKPPAATPFKSVFGTQSSGDAKPPAATPFKSDSINGFFIKQTRAGIMSEIAHSAVGDVPIDSFKADSHNGGKDAWVCTRCGKVKDLRGDHLRGKMEVRSDCWPCGKKATFKLQSRLSDDDSNNNVPAASTVDDTHQPKGVGNATIVGGFRAPVVPSTGDEHQFLFPAPVLQCSTPSLSADCSSVWKCSTCGKVKPLSGDHLRGKTEVRSDCWPCGCKRTFVLSPVDGEYGCSALPKEDASKTISKASENVKEQATHWRTNTQYNPQQHH
ncbi:Nucleoporin [Trypanosoma brucei equiperdum]|uniref:Nucleoporin n=1 Tax=Trypanosoma brucei equiperdum TaxID=630700 RepID=A0A3L6KTF7_9TRYP|nr:Nucleoporin [Trypanosoma brucei equiperdum]